MANERDFSFKCIKIALIVIHSLAIFLLSLALIGFTFILDATDKKSEGLSPEEKDTNRKFINNNS
jgi:membrane-anchored glycerophosphoryl diester phosphodiesterase (GDPDase)